MRPRDTRATLGGLGLALLLLGCGASDELDLDETDELAEGKADSTRPKLQLEVDFVGQQRFEPGTIAQLRRTFSALGYQLVIEQGEVLPEAENLVCGSTSKAIQSYYRERFRHRGQPGWFYLLMADSLDGGIGGWGMLGGDVAAIADARGWCRAGDPDPVRGSPLCRMRRQARLILHELGHNLGLTHEGFEPERSAGTHSAYTCASAAGHPKEILPVTVYSPACAAHLSLAARPLLPAGR